MQDGKYLESELHQQLASGNDLFNFVLSNAFDGVWYWNLENPEHEWMSAEFWALLGYEPSEKKHLSSEWKAIIHPDDLDKTTQNFIQHCENPDIPFDQIVRYIHKNGQTIWVRCRGITIRDENGKSTRMLGTHVDITSLMASKHEVVELSKRLAKSNELLNLALRASKVGVWDWHVIDNTLDWSREMYELYGLEEKKTVDKYQNWLDILHPEDKLRSEQDVEDALSGDRKFDTSFRVIWSNGEVRYIRALADVFFNDAGQPERMLGVNWDITKEMTQEIALKQTSEDIEQFVYIASHDLKSPINSIFKLSQWIEEDSGHLLPEESREHLSFISGRAKRMKQLLDDLLHYARVKQFDYSSEQLSLKEIVREQFILINAPESFRYEVDDVMISVPRIPFELVIRNLMSNAVKHHDRENGLIKVAYLEEFNFQIISVIDDGPGISEEHRERALEMFQTLKPRDEVEGSGMGLPMSKKVLQHYHGWLSLQSNSPRGVCISTAWPLVQ